jgi:protocatechuate 3,4-dioxygenase beta subunit
MEQPKIRSESWRAKGFVSAWPASARPGRLARRRFLKSLAAASAGFTLSGYLAEALTASPIVTQGPYYPLADDIPLDKDNDLVQLDDRTTLAAGQVTYITGRVLDLNGNPIKNALVELWHADREGDYLYSAGVGRNSACDANFAGFGQFVTGSSGAFKFRTVKAGLHNGRTRHLHTRSRPRAASASTWNKRPNAVFTKSRIACPAPIAARRE